MCLVDLLKNSINTICAKYLNENNEIEYLPIFYIAGSQTLPPPLTPEEENELIQQLSNENNLEVRQKLVERNLRLVVYIAKKFENTRNRYRRFDIYRNNRIDERCKYI